MMDKLTCNASAKDIKQECTSTKPRKIFDGVVIPTLATAKKRKAYENDQENTKVKIKKEEAKEGILFLKQEERKFAVKAESVLEDEVLPSISPNQGALVDDDQAKEDFKKLAMLKNPKLKRNDALAFLPQTLRNRLLPIGLDIQEQFFTIDQVTREVLVTRLFISKTYGGNCQQTFSRVSKAKFEKHGMDGFMFMIPTLYQPEAPQLPGAPGLWISCYPAYHVFDARVFVKIVDTMYQYQGMYLATPADPPYLTVDEYFAQTPKFRDSWARAILSESWGIDAVLRVFLRKVLKREPTPNELEIAEEGYSECVKMVNVEDIKAAYALGEESMGVWTMKCVGYENHFQREMSEKYPIWQAGVDEERRQKKKEKKEKKDKKPANSKGAGSSQTKGKTTTTSKKSTKGKFRKLDEDSDSAVETSGTLEYDDPPAPTIRRSSERKCEQHDQPAAQEAAAAEESSDGLEYVDDPSAAREVIELTDTDSDYSPVKGARLESPILVD